MTAALVGDLRQQVLEALADASSLCCCLDYDGTLAPIAATPGAAVPLPGTAGLLARLAALPATEVAIVSGRPIAEVRAFLDAPGLYYVGIHGLEMRLPGGEIRLAEGANLVRPLLPTIKGQVERVLGARPGILIEDKGAALACHYRLASAADGESVREMVAAIVRRYQQRGVSVALIIGHEVVEIRPAGVNKGKTLCALLATLTPTPLALYIGDDQTDEDAFDLLPPASITVRVGVDEVPTHARYRVDDPTDVNDFLCALLSRRGARTAATATGIRARA
jgi:trehalose 6-phosphate phosphatase